MSWPERGRDARTENYLAAAEMSEEENYNQIDGIMNNTPPKPSVREALRRHMDETERLAEAERVKETEQERTRRTQTDPER